MSSGPNYYYTWTPAQPTPARLSTSRTEIVQLLVAFGVLTVDLVILIGGGGLYGYHRGGLLGTLSVAVVLSAAAAALTGFLCHELAHKFYAQRHGFWAEFRLSPIGLVVSLVTSFAGFLWAAPGATVVSGMSELDRANWGRTSLAGPATNAVFGGIFYLAALATFQVGSPYSSWFVLLAWFNGWFATFNLLPFGPLDGAKVLRWSAAAWVGAIVAFGAFTAVATLVLYGVVNPFLGP